MYCRADIGSVTLMHEASLRFSEASGLKANNDKSSICIVGVSENSKQEIVNTLGFNIGTLSFKYLGVPLATKKLHINAYMPLIEKITAKIMCWSAKLLSYAGRVQLIKAVLF